MASGYSSNVGFGIVTALPIEFAAARQLLENQEPTSLPHDPAQYVIGEMPSLRDGPPHAVALTLLPSDGTRSAAAACMSLLAGFPTIRVIVMVGIAGGVPVVHEPRKHVRLGDIVVATEIIDYGHLRSVDGSQHLRRRLDSPSVDLVSADRILQAGEASSDRPWEAWLNDGVADVFARPPGNTDIVLLDGQPVSHPDDSPYGRRPGFPRVHRGIVASGDQLVRDVAERQRLAAKYDVCAIEMEGAGVAAGSALRSVQWFMVRGIADYCDNAIKNDLWHPYASLAAAAYTRALLAHCASSGAPSSVALRRQPTKRASALGSVRPVQVRITSPIHYLQIIVEAILDIEEILDGATLRMLVSLLPRDIQATIPNQPNPRHQIISIVRTCAAFHGGQEALLIALNACIPFGSKALERAEAAILESWHGLTD